MAAVTDYTALCERVGKWWEITVPELDSGRVTQARRLDQVDETVRSLVRLMAGSEPDCVTVEVLLPEDLRADVDRARTMRERAEREALESAALSRASAKRLAADGLSVRDIGQILGISFQRASQLLTS
jgi:hypothetical protein